MSEATSLPTAPWPLPYFLTSVYGNQCFKLTLTASFSSLGIKIFKNDNDKPKIYAVDRRSVRATSELDQHATANRVPNSNESALHAGGGDHRALRITIQSV